MRIFESALISLDVFILSILACAFVSGCDKPSYDREGRQIFKTLKKDETSNSMLQFKYIVVDDHEYLILDGSKYMNGLTHSPRCKCGK